MSGCRSGFRTLSTVMKSSITVLRYFQKTRWRALKEITRGGKKPRIQLSSRVIQVGLQFV
ncbi:hypothetical protein Egran_05860 [Elaphomyces granulatus]|uniref:Uncharacterized protein n=1 Tax=Elaphomyces granulatus TaxID=519963 RepID=A0A232LQH4_9EURO|nr:hypothetical protein Egran_05860 [Elaphomyces granulatus]